MSDAPTIPTGYSMNQPSEMGRALGKEMARFADQQEVKHGDIPPRCATCAFRHGTRPNGCLSTVGDAMKCILEQEPFYCHERVDERGERVLCMGFVLLSVRDDAESERKPIKVPWPYTGVSVEEAQQKANRHE